ncbi:MAG TPA: DUF4391 domain-containing protein [Candidatus Onthoplasma faecipullorum]|nr:DUF4391 domain-containing protein [Candidatus Onthoplasma faecipullorum]
MFIYPEKTAVNIQFKMLELFRTIKADKLVKNDATIVNKVILSNILSKDRTNLEESEFVKEIYVIDLYLTTKKVPSLFLDTLNKSINLQVLFRLHYNDSVKYIISIKLYDEEKLKILKVFESDWQEESKEEMPQIIKLESLFKCMIAKITTYPFKTEENFNQYVERYAIIVKMQNEIDKLIKKRDAEKQPNLKMRLNDEISEKRKYLQELY